MSQRNKKKYNHSSAAFLGGNYALIPLLLVLLVIPLIVRIYVYDNPLSQFSWYPDNVEDIDAFLYWKSILLSILGAVMALIAVKKLISSPSLVSYRKDIWIYFLAAYGILTLLSTLVSEYRSFGIHGIHEQFESVWVILSYCVVTFFAYLVVRSDRDLAAVRYTLVAFAAIIGLIGFTQLIGHDFFESELGKYLIVPGKYPALRNNLVFTFSGSGNHQVYMTLYNPNYVGVFIALILPVTISFCFSARRIAYKLVWAILSVLLLVCAFGAGSKAFIIAIAASALVAVIFLRSHLLRYWKVLIPVLLLAVIAGGYYFHRMNINLYQYVKNALAIEKTNLPCKDIRFTETDLTIIENDREMHVMYVLQDDALYLICTDENGTAIEYTMDADTLHFVTSDSRYSDIWFAFYDGTDEYPIIASVSLHGHALYFVSTDTGYRYFTSSGKIGEPDYPETALFNGYEHLASGRGYIWSRSIPLLKHSLLLGTGADTFSAVYPQNDVVGKINGFYDGMIITKPHCLYLQIGVQHGVAALICFLVVCVWYLVQCCRIYWRCPFITQRHWFGFGIMIGVLGYLITGITNDSTVALAPLFWALLGIGFAINRMIRQETAEAK